MKLLRWVVGIAAAVALVVATPVLAVAVVNSYFLGCSQFSAAGTTTSPYVVVEIYNPDLAQDLVFTSYPSSGGTFDVAGGFTEQGGGTNLEYWVWGSPTPDPDDWDGEAYFYTEEACQRTSILEVPTLGGWGLVALGGLLAALGLFATRRRARAAA